MKEYKEVPNMISNKDLDYLKDMFNWDYLAYKNMLDIIDRLNDNNLSKKVNDISNKLYNITNEILKIMEDHLNESC